MAHDWHSAIRGHRPGSKKSLFFRAIALKQARGNMTLMFPMALSAVRPTARQWRESGATRCGPSGTFRPRNRISITLFACSLATQNIKGLWHGDGAPPKWRFPGRGERPDQPLASSGSHRIAPARQLAPARRGTDPPGCSKIKNSSPPPTSGGLKGWVSLQAQIQPCRSCRT